MPEEVSLHQPRLQTAEGDIFFLKPGETVIGRDPSCDVRLNDLSVSKRHCVVTFSERGASVTDLGSTNHSFVNHVCLREGQSSELAHGDSLVLGRSALTFLSSGQRIARLKGAENAQDFASRKTPTESTIVSFDVGASFQGVHVDQPSEVAFKELRKANERLSIFYDFGRYVGNILDIDHLLKKVAGRIMKLVPTDSGVILLRQNDRYDPCLYWTKDGFQDAANATYSRTAVTKAIHEKRGLFVRDVSSQPDIRAAKSVRRLHIEATMIVPIALEEEVFGVLCLSTCGRAADFGRDDFAMISGIAGQLAVAIKNAHLAGEIKRTTAERERLLRELEIASYVQKSILPVSPPSIPGLDIGGISVPAREVGGDFFDYIPLGGDCLGTTIADVSGKGLAAALLTLQSRNVIHAIARENRSPAEVLHKANSVIYDDYSRADMFLSAFYATIDLSSRVLRYASAGHNPPFLVRADGTSSFLSSTGQVLGISRSLSITEESVELADRDTLALYTDGVSEARDQACGQFGCERLAQKLSEYGELPASEIADRIIRDVISFCGPTQTDDATLVIMKVLVP